MKKSELKLLIQESIKSLLVKENTPATSWQTAANGQLDRDTTIRLNYIVGGIVKIIQDINAKFPKFEKELEVATKLRDEFANILSKITKETLKEMTTTGAADGFNVPGAFSRRGGSKKGVEGSRKLGYELTPRGKKDSQLEADKL